jgi:hypothetical protein
VIVTLWVLGAVAWALLCAPLALYMIAEKRSHDARLRAGGKLFDHGPCGPCLNSQ